MIARNFSSSLLRVNNPIQDFKKVIRNVSSIYTNKQISRRYYKSAETIDTNTQSVKNIWKVKYRHHLCELPSPNTLKHHIVEFSLTISWLLWQLLHCCVINQLDKANYKEHVYRQLFETLFFLVILKIKLQNYQKVLKKYFLLVDCSSK